MKLSETLNTMNPISIIFSVLLILLVYVIIAMRKETLKNKTMNLEFEYYKRGILGTLAVGLKGKPFRQVFITSDKGIEETNLYTVPRPQDWIQYERHECNVKEVGILEQYLTNQEQTK